MQRLIFANQLRGVAAVAVIFSHLIGVFWAAPEVVAAATASPVQPGPVPGLFALVSFPGFNFGPFGVGLFFLISGLVVPFSLARHSRATFLAARLLRIYPTYVAALCLELAVVQAAALYWGQPLPFGARSVISNILLLQWLAGFGPIDLVNWTLVVELKFYLVMALAAPLVRRGSVAVLFAIAAAMVLGNLALQLPPLAGLAARHVGVAAQLSNDSIYLVFMLIGVLFHYHVRGLIGPGRLLAGVVGMLGMYLLAWRVGLIGDQYDAVVANDIYALSAFGLAYLGRRWARPIRVLDVLAAISFPLYLVHSLIGYSLLKLLMLSAGIGYETALTVTLAVVGGLAWVLHRTIEASSIVLGHRCLPRARPGAVVASAV